MPNVLVRDLPREVHAELQRRAEARGQSLQQYLTAELTRMAARPTVREWLDRIERDMAERSATPPSRRSSVEILEEAREARLKRLTDR